jgi:hypothetical protein
MRRKYKGIHAKDYFAINKFWYYIIYYIKIKIYKYILNFYIIILISLINISIIVIINLFLLIKHLFIAYYF